MDKEEKIIKHLEFIQSAISRMGSNSLMVKGWCFTVCAGIFALTNDQLPLIIVVALFFWFLDGFYIATERSFRLLYDKIRKQDDTEFNMTPPKVTFKLVFCKGVLTKTVWPYYALIIAIVIFLLVRSWSCFCSCC